MERGPLTNGTVADLLAQQPINIRAFGSMFENGVLHAWLNEPVQDYPEYSTPAESRAYLAGYAAIATNGL